MSPNRSLEEGVDGGAKCAAAEAGRSYLLVGMSAVECDSPNGFGGGRGRGTDVDDEREGVALTLEIRAASAGSVSKVV